MKIRDLHDEFTADRAAAERAYYGKYLTLEGISVRTGESQYGTPVVEVSDVDGGPHIATFVLPFDHRIKESFRLVRSVPLGVTVTVKGECRVFSEDGTVLVIKDCELLTP
ncbi:hypothetical protein [Streptomyces sp. NPDC001914]|uniref:OB-fold protein n=1 Tax=Streptomyces sp. NPDC001914 TaxID=3364623 RepID=UPI00368B2D63